MNFFIFSSLCILVSICYSFLIYSNLQPQHTFSQVHQFALDIVPIIYYIPLIYLEKIISIWIIPSKDINL